MPYKDFMKISVRMLPVMFGASTLVFAGGGGSGVKGVTAPNAGEIAVASVLAPAGGTFQLRARLTEPRPISSTGADAGGFGLNGFAVWGPNGDSAGVALVKDGRIFVNAISPTGNLAAGLDYPFLLLTMNVPGGAKVGSKFPLTLANSVMNTAAGPLTVSVKPGTLTVGGSVSIRGIYPGGGTLPAGASVRIRGSGFSAQTKLNSTVRVTTPRVVSAEELEITLQEQTTMDMQSFTAFNPDGSSSTFFSYLRGKMQQTPVRTLLQAAEPAFQLQTHALATITIPAAGAGQFTGLALQNPNPGPVVVTLQGGGQTAMIVLKSGDRVMDDLSTLLNGAVLNPGDIVSLFSTTALQILGLRGDDVAQTVMPFLPVF